MQPYYKVEYDSSLVCHKVFRNRKEMQLFPRSLYAEDNSNIQNIYCMLGTVAGLMVGDLYEVCYWCWNSVSHNLPTRQMHLYLGEKIV